MWLAQRRRSKVVRPSTLTSGTKFARSCARSTASNCRFWGGPVPQAINHHGLWFESSLKTACESFAGSQSSKNMLGGSCKLGKKLTRGKERSPSRSYFLTSGRADRTATPVVTHEESLAAQLKATNCRKIQNSLHACVGTSRLSIASTAASGRGATL